MNLAELWLGSENSSVRRREDTSFEASSRRPTLHPPDSRSSFVGYTLPTHLECRFPLGILPLHRLFSGASRPPTRVREGPRNLAEANPRQRHRHSSSDRSGPLLRTPPWFSWTHSMSAPATR